MPQLLHALSARAQRNASDPFADIALQALGHRNSYFAQHSARDARRLRYRPLPRARSGAVLFLAAAGGKKTVVTVQGLDWQRKKWGNLASAVLRVGERAAAKLPDTTMVVSRTLQSHFREQHSKETIYIPNGAELRSRRLATRILDWGIEPGNYVLFLGRFSPEKNCHLLVEAYERLHTKTQLVLAGGSICNDPYSRQLRLHASDRFTCWTMFPETLSRNC